MRSHFRYHVLCALYGALIVCYPFLKQMANSFLMILFLFFGIFALSCPTSPSRAFAIVQTFHSMVYYLSNDDETRAQCVFALIVLLSRLLPRPSPPTCRSRRAGSPTPLRPLQTGPPSPTSLRELALSTRSRHGRLSGRRHPLQPPTRSRRRASAPERSIYRWTRLIRPIMTSPRSRRYAS